MTKPSEFAGGIVGTSLAWTNAEANNLHCIHGIGLGKAGCESVDALLQQPELITLLRSDKRTTLAMLCLDAEDTYLKKVDIAAKALKSQLEKVGVDLNRIMIKLIKIQIPATDMEKADFYASLDNVPKYLRWEYPMKPMNNNYVSWIDAEKDVIPAEGEHMNRSMAKALYYDNYFRLGLKDELKEFARFINNTPYTGIVYVFFSLAGGFGSGIAPDLLRQMSNGWFGRAQQATALCYLPSDNEEVTANVFTSLEELELQINPTANKGVMNVFGENHRNPWIGSAFLIPNQSGETDALDARLVQFLADENARHFLRSVRCTAKAGAPWNEGKNFDRSWNAIVLKDIDTKSVSSAMKDFVKSDGFTEQFKTDWLQFECYLPTKVSDTLKKAVNGAVSARVLPKEEGGIAKVEYHEGNVTKVIEVLPGVCLADIKVFSKAKEVYEALDKKEQIQASAYLLDQGLIVSNPNAEMPNLVGESLWKSQSFVYYPYKRLCYDGYYPGSRVSVYDALADEADALMIHDENPLPGEDAQEYISKFSKQIGYNIRMRG